MAIDVELKKLIDDFVEDLVAISQIHGNLTDLETTQKTSLVLSINELHGAIAALQGNTGGGGPAIDDTAGAGATTVTWSASHSLAVIMQYAQQTKDELTDGAGTALDTLKEFANAINNDPSFAATMTSALGFRLRFDVAQSLTTAQQKIACSNLGIGDPTTDYAAYYQSKKTAAGI